LYPRSLYIEEFLSLQPGDVEMCLAGMNSIVLVGPNQEIPLLHASLTDFLRTLHVRKHSRSTLELDTQRFLASVFSCFNSKVCKAVPLKMFAFLFIKKNVSNWCGTLTTGPLIIVTMRK
jgi:hypothetical protein